jgi:hypothetical protein
MTTFAKIEDDYLGVWNRPLDVKEQRQGFLSSPDSTGFSGKMTNH